MSLWASCMLEVMTRASQTLPALLLGQDFANTCLRETGLFQVFWHHSHEAALQAGNRVGAFPHLHDPLCWLPGHREGSQQVLTSEPSFTRWLVCPVFLTTPTCTFLGKPWLIKEAIAVSQAERSLEPVKKDQITSNCFQDVHFFPRVHGS